jgi:hypothetical protein
MKESRMTGTLLPDESDDLIQEAQDVLGDQADAWLNQPIGVDAGSPEGQTVTRRQFAESEDGRKRDFLRNQLRAIKHGMFS